MIRTYQVSLNAYRPVRDKTKQVMSLVVAGRKKRTNGLKLAFQVVQGSGFSLDGLKLTIRNMRDVNGRHDYIVGKEGDPHIC